MKHTHIFVFFVLLLSGCAGPQFSVQPINENNRTTEITVVEDNATREVFLNSIESWCFDHSYNCNVVPDGSKHIPEELTLNYVSRWSWDFRTFIGDATIKAYKNRDLVGKVEFKAPNSEFNFDKFGDDVKRIETMMQLLFGLITETEANKKLVSGKL